MNLQYLKYATEVAATGSINRAAEKLYVSQPNLSRAIRELEASLGIRIFARSPKGMTLTREGEVFLRHAKSVLAEVGELEGAFLTGHRRHFSLCTVSSPYIDAAVARFAKAVGGANAPDMEIGCLPAKQIPDALCDGQYKLGILRYPESMDGYYKTALEEAHLAHELIVEFRAHCLFSAQSPLAAREVLCAEDLADKTVLVLPENGPLPRPENEQSRLPGTRVLRFTDMRMLEKTLRLCPDTVFFDAPHPQEELKARGLAMAPAPLPLQYKDVLCYRDDEKLTETDRMLIDELCQAKRAIFR